MDGKNPPPIGLFSPGSGALATLTNLIAKNCPGRIVYYADTKNAPFGARSPQEIAQLVKVGVEFLRSKGCSPIAIACNTSSLNLGLVDELTLNDASFPPVINIVDTTLEALQARKLGHRFLVFATNVTIASSIYANFVAKFFPDVQCLQVASSRLAKLVDEQASKSVLKREVLDCLERIISVQKIDSLLLGCTHYSLVRDVIMEVLSEFNQEPVVIDQAPLFCESILDHAKVNPASKIEVMVFVTRSSSGFEKALGNFCPGIVGIEKVQ